MECKSCLAIDLSSFHLCQHWLKCKHVLYNIGVTIYVSMNHNFEDPLTNKLNSFPSWNNVHPIHPLCWSEIGRSTLKVSIFVDRFIIFIRTTRFWTMGTMGTMGHGRCAPAVMTLGIWGPPSSPPYSIRLPGLAWDLWRPLATHHAMVFFLGDLRENLQETRETCVLVLK